MLFVSFSICDIFVTATETGGAISSLLLCDPRETNNGNELRLEIYNLTSSPLDEATLQMLVLLCDGVGLTGDLDQSNHSSADHPRLLHSDPDSVFPPPRAPPVFTGIPSSFRSLSPGPYQITGFTVLPHC